MASLNLLPALLVQADKLIERGSRRSRSVQSRVAHGLEVGIRAGRQEEMPRSFEIGPVSSKLAAVPLLHLPGREPGRRSAIRVGLVSMPACMSP